jgi:hypothetical protein
MKSIRVIATLLFCTAVAVAGFALFLPGDVVTSHYTSIAAARADYLFERGWLPDILPASTKNIRTSNNLDLNTSQGEFSFVPSDYPLLASRVQPYKNIHTPFANFENDVVRMQNKGFHPIVFAEDKSTWVFFCQPEKGCCEYIMWFHKG